MFSHYIALFLTMLSNEPAATQAVVTPAPQVQVVKHKPVKPPKISKAERKVAEPKVAEPKIAEPKPVLALAQDVDPVISAPKVSQVAAAQTAVEVVNKVQEFYNRTKSFTANFTQTVTNQTFNRRKPVVSRGLVHILKPGKMRFDYQNENRKTAGAPKVSRSFISDGKSLWAVMHKTKQYYKSSLSNSALPTAVSFLMGTGNLLNDFNVSFETSGKFGSKDDILLLLLPKSPSARYKKLWLVVDKTTFSVKESIVLNTKNDTNSIRFAAVKINSGKLKPGHFIFNAKAFKDYRLVTPPSSK